MTNTLCCLSAFGGKADIRAANWPVFTDGCMPEGGNRAPLLRGPCDSPDDFLDGLVDATTHPQIQIYPRGVGRQQGPTP